MTAALALPRAPLSRTTLAIVVLYEAATIASILDGRSVNCLIRRA